MRTCSFTALLILGLLAGCPAPTDDDETGGDDDSGSAGDDADATDGVSPVVLDSANTYWLCQYDPAQQDFFWEAQAEVEDAQNDVVTVTAVFLPEVGQWVTQLPLESQGDGTWHGTGWEAELGLDCGGSYDVLFEAVDEAGNMGSLLLTGDDPGPSIVESPTDTWVTCYEVEHEWVFEFQAIVDDPDGADDVTSVSIAFEDYYSGDDMGDSSLSYEGGGVWGSWIAEGDGNDLYCGDAYNVTFTAVDSTGLTDLFIYPWIP